MNAAGGPVVLGVGSAVLGANRAGMEFALSQARQRGVSIHVVHGCAPRHPLAPTDPWIESEQLEHGRGIVGRAAQQLRRMSRHQVTIDVTVAPTSGIDALLAASATASVVVLQTHARPDSQATDPGSTIRTVAARAACPVIVLRGGQTEGPKRGIVVGVEEHGRAQGAVRAAMEQAARDGPPVTAVYASDLPLSESSKVGVEGRQTLDVGSACGAGGGLPRCRTPYRNGAGPCRRRPARRQPERLPPRHRSARQLAPGVSRAGARNARPAAQCALSADGDPSLWPVPGAAHQPVRCRRANRHRLLNKVHGSPPTSTAPASTIGCPCDPGRVRGRHAGCR